MMIANIDPVTDPRWQTLIQKQPSSIFHSPAWIQTITETYGFDVHAPVLLDRSGAPLAGFPVCSVTDIRGKRLIIFPFSDYYDPLVSDYAQWQTLLSPLLAQRVPLRFRCLHNELPLQDSRFKLINRAKWHGVDLSPDLDDIWRNIAPECRRAIQKAKRTGLEIRHAQTPATMREFFEMHLGVRKYKYRLLAQPYHFFAKVWQYLVEPGHGSLVTVNFEGQVISAALFLRWANKCYYKFGASKSEYLSLRPNDLLIWAGIQYAKAHDDTYFDLGLSDWDQEGLIAFKRKFSTQEKTISFLEHTPEGHTSQPFPAELLPGLTQLFTEASVPDAVTERAGDLLYRYFV